MESTTGLAVPEPDSAGRPETPCAPSLGNRLTGWRLEVGLAVAVALGRIAFGIDREIFHVSPDEPANLGMARWLSGTGPWNMFDADVQRPGFALLAAPANWLTDDPLLIYRATLVIGCALAGWSAVYLARVLSRTLALDPVAAAGVAGLVALSPNLVAASAFAWSEPLVVLAFFAVVWHSLRFVEVPTWRTGLPTVVWAAVGYAANTRMTAVLVVVAAIVVVGALRRGDRQLAAGLVGLVAALAAVVLWFTSWVTDQVWESPGDANTAGSVASRLSSPVAIIESAIGQGWYLLASSALLAGLGAVEIVRAITGRSRFRIDRTDAVVISSLTLAIVGLSFVFQSGQQRPDHLIYGRYNDSVIGLIVGIGGVWLVATVAADPRRALVRLGSVAGVMFVLGAVLDARHGDQLERGGLTAMVPGIQYLRGSRVPIEVWRIGALALLLAAVLVGIAYLMRHRHWFVGAFAVVVLVSGVLAWRATEPTRNSSKAVGAVRVLDAALEDSDVGFVIDDSADVALPVPLQAAYGYLYQWYLDDTRFDSGATATERDRFFAPLGSEPADATLLWIDSTAPLGLWCRTASCPTAEGNG